MPPPLSFFLPQPLPLSSNSKHKNTDFHTQVGCRADPSVSFLCFYHLKSSHFSCPYLCYLPFFPFCHSPLDFPSSPAHSFPFSKKKAASIWLWSSFTLLFFALPRTSPIIQPSYFPPSPLAGAYDSVGSCSLPYLLLCLSLLSRNAPTTDRSPHKANKRKSDPIWWHTNSQSVITSSSYWYELSTSQYWKIYSATPLFS